MMEILPGNDSLDTSEKDRHKLQRNTANIYRCPLPKIPKPSTTRRVAPNLTPRGTEHLESTETGKVALQESVAEKHNYWEKILKGKERIYFSHVNKVKSSKALLTPRGVSDTVMEQHDSNLSPDVISRTNVSPILKKKEFANLTWSKLSMDQIEEITTRLCKHTHTTRVRESETKTRFSKSNNKQKDKELVSPRSQVGFLTQDLQTVSIKAD